MPRLFTAMHRVAAAGAAAATFVLAGCSDSTSSPSRAIFARCCESESIA